MFINTATRLTNSNLATCLSATPMPTSVQLLGAQTSSANGNVRRDIGRFSYGFGLGSASSEENHALVSGMRCTDGQVFNQGTDPMHAYQGTLSSYWHKPAAEANENRCPVNGNRTWKLVAIINNPNRLTCRWQESSI